MSFKRLSTKLLGLILFGALSYGQPLIQISEITGQAGTYAVDSEVSFSFTVSNSAEATQAGENVTQAEADAANRAKTAFNVSAQDSTNPVSFLVGTDIYGNDVEIPITINTGNDSDLGPSDSADFTGTVTIPKDGTLHDILNPGYSIQLEVSWNEGSNTGDLDTRDPSSLANVFIDVPTNVVIDRLDYPSGTFFAGDIIQITAFLRNQQPEGDVTIIRPLTPDDEIRTELYLSEDASIARMGDFLLDFYETSGGFAGFTDGEFGPRRVSVFGTPSTISDWGRNYTPQPDDGFFDISGDNVTGETMAITYEVMIPRNYSGTFFVGAVTDSLNELVELEEYVDATFDDQGDNAFVDTFSPFLRIASSSAPTTDPVSEVSDGNGGFLESGDALSENPSTSEDGTWIAFQSAATNLDPLVPGLGNTNIYLRNRETEEIILVSRTNSGEVANRDSQNPSISADGRFIAFESFATNLGTGAQGSGSQIYVYDRELQRVDRISESPAGLAGDGDSYEPAISEDGRFVVFESLATNLVPEFESELDTSFTTQIFLHDRDPDGNTVFEDNAVTHLISVALDEVANADALTPVISLDAREVVFASSATNLGAGANGISQIWLVRLGPDGAPAANPELVSVAYDSTVGGNDRSFEPAINGGSSTEGYGLQIAFASVASNLLAPGEDTNEVADIFIRNYSTPSAPVTERASLSNPRVAYGTITFSGPVSDENIPSNQPLAGETITLNDGFNTPTVLTFGADVAITGLTTGEIRDNLVDAINNAAGLEMLAYATDPPLTANGLDGLSPSILVYNTRTLDSNSEFGAAGNQAIETSSTVVSVRGMFGGGIETGFEAQRFELGEVYGSLQPSLDRSGRIVAFRALVDNMSVADADTRFIKGADNFSVGFPEVGELLRPILNFTSNVYYRDRDVDGSGPLALDAAGNTDTERASVNKFGYQTNRLLDSATSASSRAPALSANGRFIAFASDATGTGGLRFGDSNTLPLDGNNARDVFLHDRRVAVPTADVEENPPFISLTNPSDGSTVSLTSPFFVNAGALGFNEVTQVFDAASVASVEFFVNGNSVATVTEAPFSALIRPQALENLRIFAVVQDTRGNSVSSSAINVEVVPSPFETPIVEVEATGLESGASFSIGDGIPLTASILTTANSFDFLQNFSLSSVDIYVNGVSVFTANSDQETFEFTYIADIAGEIIINAAAVYVDPIENTGNFIVENVFSDSIRITVEEFDPENSDGDFITDAFDRLFGRVPTANEKEQGLAQLDGSLESRASYVAELLESNQAETSEVAMLIYRTVLGEWPDGEALDQALEDLLDGGDGISDANVLTLALVPEYERRFSALNTELGFVQQSFINKHGVDPTPQTEVRLFNSATGVDQVLATGQVIPGYLNDTISFWTQFALDNDPSGLIGPGGLPLSSLHLYAIPNDPTEDLKIALAIAAFLEVTPTDALIASFDGLTLQESLEQILSDSQSTIPTALASSVSLGDDWYWSTWFGYFAEVSTDWVFSQTFGFAYVHSSGTEAGTWFYSPQLESWLWGGSELNGFYFSNAAQSWLWVLPLEDGAGAWLLNLNTEVWELLSVE